MATMHVYLNFEGNTEEAFNFYKSVFGGEFQALQRFKDVPGGCGVAEIPEHELNKIMHVSLLVGKTSILMGTDALESMGHKLTMGNNFSISLDAESEDESDKLFNALSADGKPTMPMQKTFWNAYFGMLTDKFGVQWMINHDYNRD